MIQHSPKSSGGRHVLVEQPARTGRNPVRRIAAAPLTALPQASAQPGSPRVSPESSLTKDGRNCKMSDLAQIELGICRLLGSRAASGPAELSASDYYHGRCILYSEAIHMTASNSSTNTSIASASAEDDTSSSIAERSYNDEPYLHATAHLAVPGLFRNFHTAATLLRVSRSEPFYLDRMVTASYRTFIACWTK